MFFHQTFPLPSKSFAKFVHGLAVICLGDFGGENIFWRIRQVSKVGLSSHVVVICRLHTQIAHWVVVVELGEDRLGRLGELSLNPVVEKVAEEIGK